MLFDELTAQQRSAATSPGSIAVTAGAGTGKTKMLAARYLFHVREQQLSPLSVVAVTFTEKAADELRSRIRAVLISELADPETIAEIEAAQISTVHSLAFRICRDFYHIAELPADFSVLDDLDAPLWLSNEFEAAIGAIPREAVEYLGYEWLKGALNELLNDPFAASEALSVGAESWRSQIEACAASALNDFISSLEFSDAGSAVMEFEGGPGDRLENARQDAAWALKEIDSGGDIVSAFEKLDKMQAHLGSAKNWPEGGKERVGSSLKALKKLARKTMPAATLEFSEHDDDAARRVVLLRQAFDAVNGHLREAKLRERVLDFNDLEHYALAILRDPAGEALRHYGKRWRAFLVDEFQDTNPTQAELISLLTTGQTITIVGDEKQSIYGFRGADPGVFSRFRKKIETDRGGSEVELSQSFRTHSGLIAEMNRVFDPVLGPLHQTLSSGVRVPVGNYPPFIRFSYVGKGKDGSNAAEQRLIEAGHVAETILECVSNGSTIFDHRLSAERPVEFGDIAVLSRTWDALDFFAETFTARGIPHVNAGGGSLLETRVAIDMLALLSFLVEPGDDIHLVSVLRSPFFAVSDVELFELASGKRDGTSWWEIIRGSTGRAGAAFVLLRKLLEKRSNDASELLVLADNLTGYSAVAANLPEGDRRLADWHGVLDLVRRIERAGDRDLFGTVRQIQNLAASEVEIPRPQIEPGRAVSLMTIHKAKGLEWPFVFVVDLARRRHTAFRKLVVDRELGVSFKLDTEDNDKAEPSIYRLAKMRYDERELAETRRLLYVAITRARDRVFLSTSGDKGPALDLLMPGLELASVPKEEVDPSGIRGRERLVTYSAHGGDEPIVRIDGVRFGPGALTPTGLETYAECPKQFRYAFVDRHPGLSEGFATSSVIGSLTHKALELGIVEQKVLQRFAPACEPSLVAEALSYAETFRSHQAFAELDLGGALREEPFSIERFGTLITGVADVVGSDLVLDYKTTAEADPGRYHIQMWAYAAAFEKPRAFVAFLRQKKLVEIDKTELATAGETARELIAEIQSANYPARPAISVCKTCRYSPICEESAA